MSINRHASSMSQLKEDKDACSPLGLAMKLPDYNRHLGEVYALPSGGGTDCDQMLAAHGGELIKSLSILTKCIASGVVRPTDAGPGGTAAVISTDVLTMCWSKLRAIRQRSTALLTIACQPAGDSGATKKSNGKNDNKGEKERISKLSPRSINDTTSSFFINLCSPAAGRDKATIKTPKAKAITASIKQNYLRSLSVSLLLSLHLQRYQCVSEILSCLSFRELLDYYCQSNRFALEKPAWCLLGLHETDATGGPSDAELLILARLVVPALSHDGAACDAMLCELEAFAHERSEGRELLNKWDMQMAIRVIVCAVAEDIAGLKQAVKVILAEPAPQGLPGTFWLQLVQLGLQYSLLRGLWADPAVQQAYCKVWRPVINPGPPACSGLPTSLPLQLPVPRLLFYNTVEGPPRQWPFPLPLQHYFNL